MGKHRRGKIDPRDTNRGLKRLKKIRSAKAAQAEPDVDTWDDEPLPADLDAVDWGWSR